MARSPSRWIRKVGIAFGVLIIARLVAILAVGSEATTENSVDIDRPPEVVFDYASDMRHEPVASHSCLIPDPTRES